MDTDFLYLFPGFLCVAWSVRNSSHCCQYSLNSDINNTSGSHTQKELPRNIKTKLSWASKYFYLTFGRGGENPGETYQVVSAVGSREISFCWKTWRLKQKTGRSQLSQIMTSLLFVYFINLLGVRALRCRVFSIYILLHKISVLALIYRIVLFWPL